MFFERLVQKSIILDTADHRKIELVIKSWFYRVKFAENLMKSALDYCIWSNDRIYPILFACANLSIQEVRSLKLRDERVSQNEMFSLLTYEKKRRKNTHTKHFPNFNRKQSFSMSKCVHTHTHARKTKDLLFAYLCVQKARNFYLYMHNLLFISASSNRWAKTENFTRLRSHDFWAEFACTEYAVRNETILILKVLLQHTNASHKRLKIYVFWFGFFYIDWGYQ